MAEKIKITPEIKKLLDSPKLKLLLSNLSNEGIVKTKKELSDFINEEKGIPEGAPVSEFRDLDQLTPPSAAGTAFMGGLGIAGAGMAGAGSRAAYNANYGAGLGLDKALGGLVTNPATLIGTAAAADLIRKGLDPETQERFKTEFKYSPQSAVSEGGREVGKTLTGESLTKGSMSKFDAPSYLAAALGGLVKGGAEGVGSAGKYVKRSIVDPLTGNIDPVKNMGEDTEVALKNRLDQDKKAYLAEEMAKIESMPVNTANELKAKIDAINSLKSSSYVKVDPNVLDARASQPQAPLVGQNIQYSAPLSKEDVERMKLEESGKKKKTIDGLRNALATAMNLYATAIPVSSQYRAIEAQEKEAQLNAFKEMLKGNKESKKDDMELNKFSSSLRKDFEQASKPYLEQSQAFSKIEELRESINKRKTDPTRAESLALGYAFFKVLDPGSTVRESEFAQLGNLGMLPGQFQALFNEAQRNGGKFNKDTADDIFARAISTFKPAARQHGQIRQHYNLEARDAGIDPKKVIVQYGPQKYLTEEFLNSPIDLSSGTSSGARKEPTGPKPLTGAPVTKDPFK